MTKKHERDTRDFPDTETDNDPRARGEDIAEGVQKRRTGEVDYPGKRAPGAGANSGAADTGRPDGAEDIGRDGKSSGSRGGRLKGRGGV